MSCVLCFLLSPISHPVHVHLCSFLPLTGNQTRSVCHGLAEEEDSLLMYVVHTRTCTVHAHTCCMCMMGYGTCLYTCALYDIVYMYIHVYTVSLY